MGIGPSSSCDLDHLYKLSFPLPMKAPHLALIGQEVFEMFQHLGRAPEHGNWLAYGSGELITEEDPPHTHVAILY